ncbi:MAG: hypothetical protein R3E48_23210 [Burkholderiaceae bacterium]
MIKAPRRRLDLRRAACLSREGLDTQVLAAFGMTGAPRPDLARWETISPRAIATPEGEVTIAIVGKYTGLKDAYKSLNEALTHGGIANNVRVKLAWIESEVFEQEDPAPHLRGRRRHTRAGRLRRARLGGQDPRRREFARERRVPYFGICFGMQMACIEGAARNLARIADASSTEFGQTSEPVVGMTEWMR